MAPEALLPPIATQARDGSAVPSLLSSEKALAFSAIPQPPYPGLAGSPADSSSLK